MLVTTPAWTATGRSTGPPAARLRRQVLGELLQPDEIPGQRQAPRLLDASDLLLAKIGEAKQPRPWREGGSFDRVELIEELGAVRRVPRWSTRGARDDEREQNEEAKSRMPSHGPSGARSTTRR